MIATSHDTAPSMRDVGHRRLGSKVSSHNDPFVGVRASGLMDES